MPAAFRVPLSHARAWWHRAQGFTGPEGSIEAQLARTGWVRTLGGVDAWLGLRARRPGLRREEVDAAVVAREVRLLPSVRNCVYLLPSGHAGLALRLSEEQGRRRQDLDMAKLGVTEAELADLGLAVLQALEAGPRPTDGVRKALPPGAVRPLGEAGKKLGVTSTLPPALRLLEWAGRIERRPPEGRVDSERYTWARVGRSPFEDPALPADPVDRHALLCRLFLTCAGPATPGDFTDWSALAQKDAKAALARLDTVAVDVEGYADGCLVLAEHAPGLREAEPVTAGVAFLPCQDALLNHHRGAGVFVDPAHHAHRVPGWGLKQPDALGEVRQLALRSFLVGDRLGGLWEWDPKVDRVVTWWAFPPDAATRAGVEAEAAATRDFLVEQCGHARCHSLDTEEGLHARAELLRGLPA